MKALFTQEDLERANSLWGCSCGPAAFAFACGLTLEQAHGHFPAFRGWTNTKMMRAALVSLRRTFAEHGLVNEASMFNECPAIVRIEFIGPWTGTKWAAHHSHWIATFIGAPHVYDINGGVCEFNLWRDNVLVELLKAHWRSTGWRPTNIFLVEKA